MITIADLRNLVRAKTATRETSGAAGPGPEVAVAVRRTSRHKHVPGACWAYHDSCAAVKKILFSDHEGSVVCGHERCGAAGS